MSGGILDRSTDATHAVLRERFERARGAAHTVSGVRDNVRATDLFLASASRHLAATNAVLMPQVRRHLPDGATRAHDFVTTSRRLEIALNLVKGRLYGASYAVHLSWPEVWSRVVEPLEDALALERELVDALAELFDAPVLDELALRIYHSERNAPSRPHPFIAHSGARGAIARLVAAKVDGFWDVAEGRMVPEPVHPHKSHDSRLDQYLLADPIFDEELTEQVDQK